MRQAVKSVPHFPKKGKFGQSGLVFLRRSAVKPNVTTHTRPYMEALLFFMASITAGVWCSYYVEYLEDKKLKSESNKQLGL
ncbi:hypothetical protein GCM10007390_12620 [Persicitalea jodogahamensis]|uniref:Uncharacterized protein n=1 Tax=Persicitalea jodogahamensis TaxID=402147 RepID=A0A8J3G8P1_9BACT|nr:hypothetical protein GCM10007390_12620 [Persicitalea jodogahamensis]